MNKKFKKFWILVICLSALALYSVLCTLYLYAQDTSKEEESYFVAEKAFDDGFYDVALGLFERFLKNYPASSKAAQINLLIGQCYFHQNRYLDALAKFDQLLKSDIAKDIKDSVLYWIAEVHFKGNDFAKAAEYYQRLIDEFPKSSYLSASYYSLGWCLFQEHNYLKALEYFKIIENKFPKESFSHDAYFKIIECLYNLKDYQGLKTKAKSYLKLFSKDTTRLSYLYFYLAESDYYLNNLEEAVDEYAKVLVNSQDDKLQALSELGTGWS